MLVDSGLYYATFRKTKNKQRFDSKKLEINVRKAVSSFSSISHRHFNVFSAIS